MSAAKKRGGSDPKLPTGTHYCLCSGCGRYFGGVSGFEAHRVRFQCVDPASVGLTLDARGYWRKPVPDIAIPQLGEAKLDDFSKKPTRTQGEACAAENRDPKVAA